ncbi:MAG: hypothetical protein SGI88_09140 [Candidatus Hydrogenedentes bacterium]|nr:hypothetical protein [Candidatus Hydrogenedentota bacterium]
MCLPVAFCRREALRVVLPGRIVARTVAVTEGVRRKRAEVSADTV